MNINLVLFKKDGTISNFALPSTVTIIGRRQDCDLCIPLMVVSRRHCELNLDQGQLRIRDLGSRNGIMVNDQRIEETALNAGDLIRIGPVKFGVQIDGEPEQFIIEDTAVPQPPETVEKSKDQVVDFSEDQDEIDQALHDVDLSESHPTQLFDGFNEEINSDSPKP